MPPSRGKRSPTPVAEEPAEEKIVCEPSERDTYKKVPLPPEKISVNCQVCANEVYIHVHDASQYDEKSRQKLFKIRGASYNPPLCLTHVRSIQGVLA
jgi:hypothetical protein